MDVRQLRYFLAVVDHGGFHRAAEHLLIAQPSLSAELLVRVGRQISRSLIGQAL